MFKVIIEAVKRILGIRPPESPIQPARGGEIEEEVVFHPNCRSSIYAIPSRDGNVNLKIGLGRLAFAIDMGEGHLIPLAGIKAARFKGLPILWNGRRVGRVMGVRMGKHEIEMRCRIMRGVPNLLGSRVEIEP